MQALFRMQFPDPQLSVYGWLEIQSKVKFTQLSQGISYNESEEPQRGQVGLSQHEN